MSKKYLPWKRMLRNVLLILLLSVVGMGKMYAQNFTVDNLNYRVNEDGVSVTVTGHVNGTSATGTLIIPESVTYQNVSYSVTTIGESAFSNYSNLTGTLTIPNSVTMISMRAFMWCRNIVSLNLGNSVTRIDFQAFSGCSRLNSINFPNSNSLTYIGSQAFVNNSDLYSITIPNSVIYIESSAFDYTGWYFQQPDGILYLDGWCMGYKDEGNQPIGELEFLEGTKGIAGSAFNFCTGLTSVTFPSTMAYIYGFYGCTGLTSVTIPSSVTAINAFSNCTNLTVHYSGNIAQWCGIAFGWENVLPSSFPYGYNLYIENELVTNQLDIPETVTSIGQGAFYGCNGITSVTIPNSVTTIGESAFFSPSLTSVHYMGDIAQWCGISFEGGAFPYYDFYIGEELITNLVIPETVTSIGQYTFFECSSITSITIPNSVTSIGTYAFAGCIGLTGDLIIPNSVTLIGDRAFSDCSGLTSLTIGNSVTSIGEFAFSGCTNLESMTVLAETPPEFGYNDWGYNDNAFYNVPKSIPVYVPCGSLEAYQSAAYWNEFTNIQESCSHFQTITFVGGWKWFSTIVGITLDDLKAALVAAFPGSIIKIISQNNGSTTYNGSIWRGTLNALDPTQMYLIQTISACEITLTGMLINPVDHPVTIHNGTNWFTFQLSESMTLDNVFAGFAVNGDIVISQFGSATYNGSTWRGSLGTLEPGQGYMYKSSVQDDRIFTFPVSTR